VQRSGEHRGGGATDHSCCSAPLSPTRLLSNGMIHKSIICIVADDLTGAADCAARCQGAGLSARVILELAAEDTIQADLDEGGATEDRPSSPWPDRAPRVLACTSDSRHLLPEAAAERVQTTLRLLRPLVAGRSATWYKKIDSTLRGNLGSELEALLAAVGAPCAVVCPAFPAQGRGLHQGALIAPTLDGAGPHLPTLLREQSRLPVELIDLALVRSGVDELAGALARAQGSGAALIVVDALTDGDLHTLVAASDRSLPDALLCGSAGLVGTLAAKLSTGEHTPAPIDPPSGSALLVVGSGSRAAHRQIAYLRDQTGCAEHVIDEDLPDTRRETQAVRLASGLPPLSHLPPVTVLHQAPPQPGVPLDGPEARQRAERLGVAALALIDQLQPGLVVLVGGDTAGAVLRRLGVAQLTVVRELLPGMPLAWGEDALGVGHQIVLKAGNHGDDTTLLELVRKPYNGW